MVEFQSVDRRFPGIVFFLPAGKDRSGAGFLQFTHAIGMKGVEGNRRTVSVMVDEPCQTVKETMPHILAAGAVVSIMIHAEHISQILGGESGQMQVLRIFIETPDIQAQFAVMTLRGIQQAYVDHPPETHGTAGSGQLGRTINQSRGITNHTDFLDDRCREKIDEASIFLGPHQHAVEQNIDILPAANAQSDRILAALALDLERRRKLQGIHGQTGPGQFDFVAGDGRGGKLLTRKRVQRFLDRILGALGMDFHTL